MHDVLEKLKQSLQEASDNFCGYPCNLNFNYDELLPFLKFGLNNVGEPFRYSNHHINTHTLETEVIQFYGSLIKAPANDLWGYVTNGGTEGNMYGLYLARELHPTGIVYYSETTHYSVHKIIRLLNMRSIMIRADDKGKIDIQDLREMIKTHRDTPVIIFANFGTTMTGAVDDIHAIKQILTDYKIDNSYIHGDGALSGMILPFIDNNLGFDFESGLDSACVSGHKFIGSPIPCGIVIAKKKNINRISRDIEYIAAPDNTITGSRNGFTPLILWYAFNKFGFGGIQKMVKECLSLADYTIQKFAEFNIKTWRNDYSITVILPRPSEIIIKKYQLAPEKDIAHIICMHHLNTQKIDRIVHDIAIDLLTRKTS